MEEHYSDTILRFFKSKGWKEGKLKGSIEKELYNVTPSYQYHGDRIVTGSFDKSGRYFEVQIGFHSKDWDVRNYSNDLKSMERFVEEVEDYIDIYFKKEYKKEGIKMFDKIKELKEKTEKVNKSLKEQYNDMGKLLDPALEPIFDLSENHFEKGITEPVLEEILDLADWVNEEIRPDVNGVTEKEYEFFVKRISRIKHPAVKPFQRFLDNLEKGQYDMEGAVEEYGYSSFENYEDERDYNYDEDPAMFDQIDRMLEDKQWRYWSNEEFGTSSVVQRVLSAFEQNATYFGDIEAYMDGGLQESKKEVEGKKVLEEMIGDDDFDFSTLNPRNISAVEVMTDEGNFSLRELSGVEDQGRFIYFHDKAGSSFALSTKQIDGVKDTDTDTVFYMKTGNVVTIYY